MHTSCRGQNAPHICHEPPGSVDRLCQTRHEPPTACLLLDTIDRHTEILPPGSAPPATNASGGAQRFSKGKDARPTPALAHEQCRSDNKRKDVPPMAALAIDACKSGSMDKKCRFPSGSTLRFVRRLQLRRICSPINNRAKRLQCHLKSTPALAVDSCRGSCHDQGMQRGFFVSLNVHTHATESKLMQPCRCSSAAPTTAARKVAQMKQKIFRSPECIREIHAACTQANAGKHPIPQGPLKEDDPDMVAKNT